LLYHFIKILARLAIKIFCRKIIINKPQFLDENGPLLLASNHPNSFLDSVILDTLFKKPVWSLARGDVFKKPIYIKLLTLLKILPVYRTSEGVENLSENYKTFDACLEIFKANGIVTIFSEGKCINEWHLRPLKKGTARLTMKAWEENIPLKVLPVGINYSSFTRFGKNVFINFGEIIDTDKINIEKSDGHRYQAFNNILQMQLEKLVFKIPIADKGKQSLMLEKKPNTKKQLFLSLPAILGWILHAPLYLPVKKIILPRFKETGHYDSIITGLTVLFYPVYLITIVCILLIITKTWWMLFLLFLIPFTAWSYVQLKPQLDI
jgi:1-acyl-sn-glycerol-3-phosphate acyltransferase